MPSGKPKKRYHYNTRLVKDNYSYYVEQIADTWGVDIATVRRWIRKEGLERIPKSRPHLVHSSKLKPFLEKKNKAREFSCGDQEAPCFRCQLPRIPKPGSGTITPLPNGCVRFQAKCSVCNGTMNRTIKRGEWSENHLLAVYLKDATEQHRGVDCQHPECSLQQEGKPCLNITP